MPELHSKTDAILERFAELSAIPRPSKREARVLSWLKEWAARLGYAHRSDAVGNLVIEVPPGPGRQQSAPLILQAHVDMVCEKTPDSRHDFTRDPIRLVRDGDWLRADGTTLGSDNGAAVALMMLVGEDPALSHPPLE